MLSHLYNVCKIWSELGLKLKWMVWKKKRDELDSWSIYLRGNSEYENNREFGANANNLGITSHIMSFN